MKYESQRENLPVRLALEDEDFLGRLLAVGWLARDG
jgi:hypothetical protein